MDIDVEHEGQRTKVTPPPQGAASKVDMDVGGASDGGGVSGGSGANDVGGASSDGGTSSEGLKVSLLPELQVTINSMTESNCYHGNRPTSPV